MKLKRTTKTRFPRGCGAPPVIFPLVNPQFPFLTLDQTTRGDNLVELSVVWSARGENRAIAPQREIDSATQRAAVIALPDRGQLRRRRPLTQFGPLGQHYFWTIRSEGPMLWVFIGSAAV